MHPAYSVIFFTTASGAGYGLLFWLLALALTGRIETPSGLGLAGFGVGLALVAGGLASSTFHLGHPERAWRAFSQWRSSWLSREGVLAAASFVPLGLAGLGWLLGLTASTWWAIIAAAGAVLALATVWSTGMIYASLPTIRAWHQPLVAPVYLVLALATGGLLATALLALFGIWSPPMLWLALLALLAGWLMKTQYWSTIDSAPRTWTAESATGLGRFGAVSQLDPPHTQANFVMREMGFQVARKHAQRLRLAVAVLLFLLPALGLIIAMGSGGAGGTGIIATAGLVLAVLSATAGVLAERWLFFAEAKHVVTLYYGASTA